MLTMQIERTDSFAHPTMITYLCSHCGKSRRPNAIVRRYGMCRTCYRIKRTHERRVPCLATPPQKRAWKLDQLFLCLGVTFCLTSLIGVIGGAPLPVWMSYILAVPLGLIALALFFGIAVGSNYIVMFDVQHRPGCIDMECEAQPRLIEKYAGGKSFWMCSEGHSFYIGRLGNAARSLKSAW